MAIPRNSQATALRGLDGQQAGQYAPNNAPWVPSGALAVTANRAWVVRFISERRQVITKLAFLLAVAAGSNDNCDVGIFDSTLTKLLASSGSTAGKLNGALGWTQVPLAAPIALKQGVPYYAAFTGGPIGTTAAQFMAASLGNSNMGRAFGLTAGLAEMGFADTAFPLAQPFTINSAISSVAILALLQ